MRNLSGPPPHDDSGIPVTRQRLDPEWNEGSRLIATLVHHGLEDGTVGHDVLSLEREVVDPPRMELFTVNGDSVSALRDLLVRRHIPTPDWRARMGYPLGISVMLEAEHLYALADELSLGLFTEEDEKDGEYRLGFLNCLRTVLASAGVGQEATVAKVVEKAEQIARTRSALERHNRYGRGQEPL